MPFFLVLYIFINNKKPEIKNMKINRRNFLGKAGITFAGSFLNSELASADFKVKDYYKNNNFKTIDRYKLVTSHNPGIRAIDPYTPLSVGNGEFAFTADVTGLQSFPTVYDNGLPLCTMSHWGWHSFPRPMDMQREDLELTMLNTYGRDPVGYPIREKGQTELYAWLRQNPHRLHLGRIGLRMTLDDGTPVEENDLEDINQVLNLWTGILESRFKVDGLPVYVKTAVHPEKDILSVDIESPLISQGRLATEFVFPYAEVGKEYNGAGDYASFRAADWFSPQKHSTVILEQTASFVKWLRILDKTTYFCSFFSSDNIKAVQVADHHYLISSETGGSRLSFSCLFSQIEPRCEIDLPRQVITESEKHWEKFWSVGGAVELHNSKDQRAPELERRIILSQYLTAINSAGSLPPQETGLTCNSWFGKFHLEMHWMHAAHFPMWNRPQLLERSLWWYQSVLNKAKSLAEQQGYDGARWPKMTGPEGLNSPGLNNVTCIWQQPHIISFAEYCYQLNPTNATLNRYLNIVSNTADFMASFVGYDKVNDRYVLGPPINDNTTREIETTINPPFNLEQWVHGLTLAQQWCVRLGIKPNPKWGDVIRKISHLPVRDGAYIHHENTKIPFSKGRHVLTLGAYGMLPGRLTDMQIMKQTFFKMLKEKNWKNDTWGWDIPLTAMTAARLGYPELAIDALFIETPMNNYLANGHVSFGNERILPCYLPGNGSLLSAVAMMAAGWKDGPDNSAPGFPKINWQVRSENLHALL